MAMKTPWAVLLCRWKDSAVEPRKIDFFRRLFTSDGVGTGNMVDFFDQMSHGAVDLSGSRVFGWYPLSKPQSAYAGNIADDKVPAGQINRQGLVDLAKQAALDNKVDLSAYHGVVVCMNTITDLFGGGGKQALCDPNSFEPSALGQEMGHGYGLAHSRRDGSTADYQDPWDAMSTWDSAYMAAHPEYTRIGPGLNAANMLGRGWLDEARVWYGPSDTSTEIVELRPLHRRDLRGFLAAHIPGVDGTRYLFELRLKTGWDAAIPRPAILVHRLEGNCSYLMSGRSGASDLVAGDAFEQGTDKILSEPYLLVEVISIDAARQKATLRVSRRAVYIEAPAPIRRASPTDRRIDIVSVESGGLVDGGGWVIAGGRVIRIPPWNPMAFMVEQIAAYQAAEIVPDANVQATIRQHALRAMADRVAVTLDRTPSFRVPAPRDSSSKGEGPERDEASHAQAAAGEAVGLASPRPRGRRSPPSTE